MGYEYMTASINSSPTITAELGEAIENAPHKAVAFNDNGELVLAKAGADAFGVLISTTSTSAAKGEEVTAQIRHIGLMEAGGAIPKGSLVSVDDTGRAVVATGSVTFGRAFSKAEGAGEIVEVNIAPCGNVSAAAETEGGED